MGNKQSSNINSEDSLDNYILELQVDNTPIKIISEDKKKVVNEEFIYFTLNKTIDYLINKDISVTYINKKYDYHNIFKFKIELSESKFVFINSKQYYELEYKSLPPIDNSEKSEIISKLYCRYLSLDTNSVKFVITTPVIQQY
jgi:hypothetical protein